MLIGIIVFSLFQVATPDNTAYAATFQDGTYDVSFSLKEAGSNNASIADGYFSKPAKLVVKNGVNHVQLTTTESDWLKSISGPKGNASDLGGSGNSRTVQLEVGDLSNPVDLKMHVVVPEEIAGMAYDHNHSVRAVFDVSNVPLASGEAAEESSSNQGTEETATNEQAGSQTDNQAGSKTDNPKTGDTSPIGVYVFLLLLSISTYVIYHLRVAKN